MNRFIVKSTLNNLLENYPILKDKVKQDKNTTHYDYVYYAEGDVYEFAKYIIENNIYNSVIVDKIDHDTANDYQKDYDYQITIYDGYIE